MRQKFDAIQTPVCQMFTWRMLWVAQEEPRFLTQISCRETDFPKTFPLSSSTQCHNNTKLEVNVSLQQYEASVCEQISVFNLNKVKNQLNTEYFIYLRFKSLKPQLKLRLQNENAGARPLVVESYDQQAICKRIWHSYEWDELVYRAIVSTFHGQFTCTSAQLFSVHYSLKSEY